MECKGVVWCEVGCDVLWEYGVGSGEREDKQCRRRRALIVQIGGVLPRWLWPEDSNRFAAKPGKIFKKRIEEKTKINQNDKFSKRGKSTI